jgi:hypothetical protein
VRKAVFVTFVALAEARPHRRQIAPAHLLVRVRVGRSLLTEPLDGASARAA